MIFHYWMQLERSVLVFEINLQKHHQLVGKGYHTQNKPVFFSAIIIRLKIKLRLENSLEDVNVSEHQKRKIIKM